MNEQQKLWESVYGGETLTALPAVLLKKAKRAAAKLAGYREEEAAAIRERWLVLDETKHLWRPFTGLWPAKPLSVAAICKRLREDSTRYDFIATSHTCETAVCGTLAVRLVGKELAALKAEPPIDGLRLAPFDKMVSCFKLDRPLGEVMDERVYDDRVNWRYSSGFVGAAVYILTVTSRWPKATCEVDIRPNRVPCAVWKEDGKLVGMVPGIAKRTRVNYVAYRQSDGRRPRGI